MIDINKKYTFNGESGAVLTVTGSMIMYPVVWQAWTGNIYTFTAEGRRLNPCGPICLIEVKPTRWVNVYPSYVGGPYSSRVNADTYAGVSRIACIEFTEGDGIDV